VTTGEFVQFTPPGIHAVYEDLPYDVALFRRYFASLDDATNACLGLALQNPVVREATREIDGIYYDYQRAITLQQREREAQLLELLDRWESREGEGTRTIFKRRPRPSNEKLQGPLSLDISRLRIESPMELTLAVAVEAALQRLLGTPFISW
jgi:hypothetical protein